MAEFVRASRVRAPAAPARPSRAKVQRALEVGRADDPLEVEAERVAAEVVRRLESGGAAPEAAPFGEPVTRLQRRADATMSSAAGREGGLVDGPLESRIRASSGGQPIDPGLRRQMESGFGADFGAVRIHTGSTDAVSIGARAFTAGHHVHFAPGAYEPGSADGRRLLAHELTHTLQQGAVHRAVRRDHTDTGMKKKEAVKTYAKKVTARTTSGKNPLGSTKDWAGLDANARAAKLIKYVNAELKSASAPPVTFTLDPSKGIDNAAFDFQTWSVSIGSNGLDGALTDAQIAELADTVYHECRHSEQWFRIARVKAGETPKPTKTSVAQALFIPEGIAKKAMDAPIKPLTEVQKFFHTKGWIERQDTKLAEAQSWYDSVYGANAAHRNAVLSDLANRDAEYRALAEEVDAWGVAALAKTKVRDLIAAVRLKQQAAAAAG